MPERVRLLDVDRELGSGLSEEELAVARRYAVADVVDLHGGPMTRSSSTAMACSDCSCLTDC